MNNPAIGEGVIGGGGREGEGGEQAWAETKQDYAQAHNSTGEEQLKLS